ncbi:MAG: Dabb family protein [Acidimicrobiales bacterium]
MLRHLAVFRWLDGTTEAQVSTVTEALRQLPAEIPNIRAYTAGPDARLGDDRWDFAVVADFDDAEGYRAYLEHPAHQAVAAGLIAPIRADRVHVQLEL